MFTLYKNHFQMADESFKHIHWKARRDALFRKLLGKQTNLARIDEAAASQGRRHLGRQTIPTGKINGTFGRSADFDRQFRPLKDHLRGRWVDIALNATADGWQPIKVVKLGENYFVLDGHLRVSVARSARMVSIEAEVWEVQADPVNAETPEVTGHRTLSLLGVRSTTGC